MRIAVVSCVWPPYGGGVGVVAWSQARALVRLGHHITVFTPAYHGEKNGTQVVGGVTIHFLRPVLFFGNAAVLPQLLWKIKGFDIIHLHLYFIGSTWFVKCASFLRKIPYVAQYHNDLGGDGVRQIFFKLYTNFFLMGIVRCSKLTFGLSSEHVGGCDLHDLPVMIKNQIVYLANGVDEKKFFPRVASVNLRSYLQISPNVRILLFVSTLDPSHHFKGLSVLLKAVAKLQSQVQNIHLLIVGEGESKKDYQSEVLALGLAGKVTFAGLVKQDELPEYYRLADIFVMPSVSVESFSLTTLEAMACERAVVASALPGPAALVASTGLLVTPGDSEALGQAIKNLLDNPVQANALGQAARVRVLDHYTWDRVVDKLITYYQSIVT